MNFERWDGWYVCPLCGTADTKSVGNISGDGSRLTMRRMCNRCGESWLIVYRPTNFQIDR